MLHNKTVQYNVQTKVISVQMTQLEAMHYAPIDAVPPCCFVQRWKLIKPRYIQLSANIFRNSDEDLKILKISFYRIAGAQATVMSWFGNRILNRFAWWVNTYFGVHGR